MRLCPHQKERIMAKTILILAANPKNTPTLRLDQEVREIDNGLQRAQKREDFVLRQKWAARAMDVRRAMLDYRPNIVHFCGHGAGEEGIAFEDENGQARLASTDALAGFFELFADKVECVILNACYSEAQAEAIAKHIPFVIGMNKAIGDTAAIEFAVAFYDALGAGESVEFAYKLACNAIQWAGTSEHMIPVLKSKSKIATVRPASQRPESLSAPTRSAQPAFRMTVEDVFAVRGRGTVVTGRIESGTLKVGDQVRLRGQTTVRKLVVAGIEQFHTRLTQAQAGDNVGIVFHDRDLTKHDVRAGDVLQSAD